MLEVIVGICKVLGKEMSKEIGCVFDLFFFYVRSRKGLKIRSKLKFFSNILVVDKLLNFFVL